MINVIRLLAHIRIHLDDGFTLGLHDTKVGEVGLEYDVECHDKHDIHHEQEQQRSNREEFEIRPYNDFLLLLARAEAFSRWQDVVKVDLEILLRHLNHIDQLLCILLPLPRLIIRYHHQLTKITFHPRDEVETEVEDEDVEYDDTADSTQAEPVLQ